MDAVLIREAGGLGDVLQIGSAAAMLRQLGYNTHFYTLADPAILELANLMRGIDLVHPLRIAISQRRERGDKTYDRYQYLSAPLVHASLTDARQSWNRLYDLFCPAWLVEMAAAKQGKRPGLSRAQAFVEACGFDPALTKPARLLVPDRPVVLAAAEALKSNSWNFVCLWSRDPARSIPNALGDLLVRSIAREYGPTVTFHFPEGACAVADARVFRYPDDVSSVKPGRTDAVGDILALMSAAKRVIAVDTFALHVAGSLGKPTTLLCGPTFPETVAAHYAKINAWVPEAPPECYGCYYLPDRGFSKKCRSNGCKILSEVRDKDVLRLIEGAGEACVRS